MNNKNLKCAQELITRSYALQAEQGRNQRENLITILLTQRCIPSVPWDELTIQLLLQQLAIMDSNNFLENVGIGEREGRVYGGVSSLVSRRNYGMAHGIGRSGDISALQPKAAGCSLLAKLTSFLVRHAIHLSGTKAATRAVVIPVSTGMAITLAFMTIRSKRPNAKYIIWPRIDQKTCFKSILTAGYIPIVIENILVGDQLITDIEAIHSAIKDKGAEQIACIFTTTSCFAPRSPDLIEDISKICLTNDIPHIINNAYGLQLSKVMHQIDISSRKGRVDYFIQSTDKNFLVPVGGSVVASSNKQLITEYCEIYPGRASSSPVIDVFIQLLTMGESGYKQLLNDRKEMFKYLHQKLSAFATSVGERILITPNNQISMGMTLNSFDNPTLLGSMLFTRCCSGQRVVPKLQTKKIGEYTFPGYGSHHNHYPHHYITVAAAIGMTKYDVDVFFQRLNDSITEYRKQHPTHIRVNDNIIPPVVNNNFQMSG